MRCPKVTVQRRRLNAHPFRRFVCHFVGDHVKHQIIGVTGIANAVARARRLHKARPLTDLDFFALAFYASTPLYNNKKLPQFTVCVYGTRSRSGRNARQFDVERMGRIGCVPQGHR